MNYRESRVELRRKLDLSRTSAIVSGLSNYITFCYVSGHQVRSHLLQGSETRRVEKPDFMISRGRQPSYLLCLILALPVTSPQAPIFHEVSDSFTSFFHRVPRFGNFGKLNIMRASLIFERSITLSARTEATRVKVSGYLPDVPNHDTMAKLPT